MRLSTLVFLYCELGPDQTCHLAKLARLANRNGIMYIPSMPLDNPGVRRNAISKEWV